MNFIQYLGNYMILVSSLFTKPEKLKMYWKETIRQIHDIGVGSLGIIAIISTFVGAVTSVQFAYQLVDIGLIPMWWLGLIVRDSMVLELAPTLTALLLAGKVGSNMASELGTMRISEQIDALEIMGINTRSYLIGPKVFGSLFIIPMLVIIAVFLGIMGGMVSTILGGFASITEYARGVQDDFDSYYIFIMLVKSFCFAFIIPTVSCYQGFFVKGGALEIGQASTRAVVHSSIVIIIANFLVAFILL